MTPDEIASQNRRNMANPAFLAGQGGIYGDAWMNAQAGPGRAPTTAAEVQAGMANEVARADAGKVTPPRPESPVGPSTAGAPGAPAQPGGNYGWPVPNAQPAPAAPAALAAQSPPTPAPAGQPAPAAPAGSPSPAAAPPNPLTGAMAAYQPPAYVPFDPNNPGAPRSGTQTSQFSLLPSDPNDPTDVWASTPTGAYQLGARVADPNPLNPGFRGYLWAGGNAYLSNGANPTALRG